MALFLNYPQVNSIAFQIFKELDTKTFISCVLVNKAWYSYFSNPRLWLRKCIENEDKWRSDSEWKSVNEHWFELIQFSSDSENQDLESKLTLYLKRRLLRSFETILDCLDIAPINFATEFGHFKVVRTIMERQEHEQLKLQDTIDKQDKVVIVIEDTTEDVKVWNPSKLPIHQAAKNGHLDILQHFLKCSELKTPNHFYDKLNITPLEYAAKYGRKNVIKYLKTYPKNTECKAFDFAMKKGHVSTGCLLDLKRSIRYLFNLVFFKYGISVLLHFVILQLHFIYWIILLGKDTEVFNKLDVANDVDFALQFNLFISDISIFCLHYGVFHHLKRP